MKQSLLLVLIAACTISNISHAMNNQVPYHLIVNTVRECYKQESDYQNHETEHGNLIFNDPLQAQITTKYGIPVTTLTLPAIQRAVTEGIELARNDKATQHAVAEAFKKAYCHCWWQK